jgi:hypothetical protein
MTLAEIIIKLEELLDPRKPHVNKSKVEELLRQIKESEVDSGRGN